MRYNMIITLCMVIWLLSGCNRSGYVEDNEYTEELTKSVMELTDTTIEEFAEGNDTSQVPITTEEKYIATLCINGVNISFDDCKYITDYFVIEDDADGKIMNINFSYGNEAELYCYEFDGKNFEKVFYSPFFELWGLDEKFGLGGTYSIISSMTDENFDDSLDIQMFNVADETDSGKTLVIYGSSALDCIFVLQTDLLLDFLLPVEEINSRINDLFKIKMTAPVVSHYNESRVKLAGNQYLSRLTKGNRWIWNNYDGSKRPLRMMTKFATVCWEDYESQMWIEIGDDKVYLENWAVVPDVNISPPSNIPLAMSWDITGDGVNEYILANRSVSGYDSLFIYDVENQIDLSICSGDYVRVATADNPDTIRARYVIKDDFKEDIDSFIEDNREILGEYCDLDYCNIYDMEYCNAFRCNSKYLIDGTVEFSYTNEDFEVRLQFKYLNGKMKFYRGYVEII